MEKTFPIWDATATYILTDDGQEIWMSESDIRRNIGARKLGVIRPRSVRSVERRIFLKVEEEEIFERKLRRIDPAQPFCVRIPVGDRYHSYMHVRARCEASYDGRSLEIGVDRAGQPVYTKRSISSACL